MAGRSMRSGNDETPVKAHLLVIEARYYDAIGRHLLEGAEAEMSAFGVTWDVVSVPGALEIPQVLSLATANGLIPSTSLEPAKYDGAVVLGCVIRGETSHYDIVCGQSNHWLNETAMTAGIPLGNAILTVDTEEQALARAEGMRKGKGADAVRACLAVLRQARAFEEMADAG